VEVSVSKEEEAQVLARFLSVLTGHER